MECKATVLDLKSEWNSHIYPSSRKFSPPRIQSFSDSRRNVFFVIAACNTKCEFTSLQCSNPFKRDGSLDKELGPKS